MFNLRHALIKLADDKPHLREDLVPLLARQRTAASSSYRGLAKDADDLAKDCKEIAKAARAGNDDRIANLAQDLPAFRAKCKVVATLLKDAGQEASSR